ncbi:hypothetical protein HMPREF9714_02571 [Myroides odoratimimus CCUG 12901]|uniref:hypothetical protein n=1 Tax=Myroides odoratimimus TaxID=76832 RepID=UPI000246076F|nr:hypothetical protein [Myroides odoratimimus]EHO07491.1 hypothetical protein HMPREF9714_02571 [Myroides odoratimimus CCUG 12901]MDM1093860.1 hypothetical protein [Myroides odoratimimus]MDM1326549.1 hypothetical protein [Myroides odoratimimus]MDM1454916.1 hypothetical protein [Myroides odoratimimus]MDM1478638.1 hypothetical protein [Myroides odoratimimus]
MKKLFLFLITSISLSVVSCSSDDNSKNDPKPTGYPEQVNNVDFSNKQPGDTAILKGKSFDESKAGEYTINFTKKLPSKKTNAEKGTRALQPGESDTPTPAYIFKVTPTEVHFEIPKDAGNGRVDFIYKNYTAPIGTYQVK